MKNYDGSIEVNWPHDNGDFNRCMKFFEAVPEAKVRLVELRDLSSEWNNLVSNWQTINDLIKNNKTDESYDLIKQSLGKINKLKLK